MKNKTLIVASMLFLFSSCKDLLDRPELTKVTDNEETFWRNDNDLRLYANDFYANYFVGYNTGYGMDYTPLRGYNFADDFTSENLQAALLGSLPTTAGGSNSATPATLRAEHPGPNWNFYWVRKANVFIDRIENVAKPNVSQEVYAHWSAVARFFRGYEYSRLVSNFGDVPYFDAPIAATDFTNMYKDRDNRAVVMDKVYDDFLYVLQNMRESDGANYVNRYAAAALISSLMLFEGSWQHYHELDKDRAQKYVALARDAAQYVMDSGKWSFTADFKSLFSSDNLANNPEVIFHRAYDDALAIRHSVSSYSNGTELQTRSANLDLLSAFICVDGRPWQNSTTPAADNFSLKYLVRSRDPRFEATFMDTLNAAAVGTLVYAHKFAGREALNYIGNTYPAKWSGNTNVNDAPIVRLAEVVLNWVEAKAILAEYFGYTALNQADLDLSINAIRNRPLDDVALAKGLVKTAALSLSSIPNDDLRDADVSPLLWEIRRERRMEFVFEYARIQDLRRWKKLHYLNFNKDAYKLGSWVIGVTDFKDPQHAGKINPAYKDRLTVMKANGNMVTFTGNNDAEIEGYYVVRNFANRLPVQDRNYLAPLSISLIQAYKDRGFTITQTKGW